MALRVVRGRDLFKRELRGLVIDGGGIEFSGETFRSLCRPGVYVYLHGFLPLYIGSGGACVSGAGSRRQRLLEAREEADRVLIYPCVSLEASRKLETLLIDRLKPVYNQRG